MWIKYLYELVVLCRKRFHDSPDTPGMEFGPGWCGTSSNSEIDGLQVREKGFHCDDGKPYLYPNFLDYDNPDIDCPNSFDVYPDDSLHNLYPSP